MPWSMLHNLELMTWEMRMAHLKAVVMQSGAPGSPWGYLELNRGEQEN